jgi:hypothetical protein
MSTYAVNDRQIIAIWSDGEKRRWEPVTAVKDLAGIDVVASALEAVSHTLWQRCEFLGERERIAAIVRSALRRNGSESPNRRRAKVIPVAWDIRTQAEIGEVVRQLGSATETLPESVRSGVRVEVLRELDAVYTWANGGRDRNGRVGQMQLPTTHRLDMVGLGRSLAEVTQHGSATQPLNDVTQALLTLLLVAAATGQYRQTPRGRGRTTTGAGGHDTHDEGMGEAPAVLEIAVDLVLADNDASAVLRACIGDNAAKNCGLVGAWPYYSFSQYRQETSDADAYRTFAQQCECRLQELLGVGGASPVTTRIVTGDELGRNHRAEISPEHLKKLGPRAQALAWHIGVSGGSNVR